MKTKNDGARPYDSAGPVELNLTAMAYWTDRQGRVGVEIMNVDTTGHPTESDLRMHRRSGVRNAKLKAADDREILETLVVFSPRTSAGRAIRSLKKLIACIEDNGLVTGFDASAADYYVHENAETSKARR